MAGLFGALISVYLIACTMPREGRIINNTYVNHVNVSGLDEAEAARRIQEDFEKSFAYQSLTVEAAGQRYTVMINNSLAFDAAAAAKEACEFAHGSFLTRGYDVLKAAIFTQKFSFNPHIADEEVLKKAVEDSGLEKINTTVQTIYDVDGEEMVFTKGTTGESVDVPALIRRLEETVLSEDYVSVIKSPMKKEAVAPTDMVEVQQNVHSEKKDATLDPERDYQIVPSCDAVDFDVDRAQEEFDKAPEGSRVVIPLKVDKADVSTEDLQKNLFKDKLGECSTELSGSEERISNIRLAAEKIDGEILLAGETFSFNDVVGERTKKRGFLTASSFPDGETPEQMGGGISQASSTLYLSAMRSNLAIVERESHQYKPDYIDKGMDADVDWDDQDFRFTNDTKYPVRIEMKCEDEQLIVKIRGTNKEQLRVKITAKTLDVIGYDTVYKADSSLKVGKEVIITSGADGYEVQTYRKIYNKKGKRIAKKKEALSTYEKRNAVVAYGTAKRKKKKKKKEEGKETNKETNKTAKKETNQKTKQN